MHYLSDRKEGLLDWWVFIFYPCIRPHLSQEQRKQFLPDE